MNDDEVIAEFKKTKQKFFFILIVTIILFAGGFVVVYSALIGVVLFNIGVLVVYRCPRCRKIPTAEDAEGVELSPERCGKCGAPLK